LEASSSVVRVAEGEVVVVALWQLLEAVRRHVAIVAIGAVLTLFGLWYTHSRPGVYQVRIGMILAPANPAIGANPLLGREYSIIATAGVLVSVAGQHSEARTSSSVTLAGKGVKDGYSVDLPNKGGQFAFDYDRPIIDIQAVGMSEQAARSNLDEAMSEVTTALAELQDAEAVPAAGRLTLHPSPAEVEVGYSRGRPTRSMVAVLVLGMALTLTAVIVVDDRWVRRRPAGQPVQ
jgi:hypothetical protein